MNINKVAGKTPQPRAMAKKAEESGNTDGAAAVRKVIDEVLARPEHEWFEKKKVERTARREQPPGRFQGFRLRSFSLRSAYSWRQFYTRYCVLTR